MASTPASDDQTPAPGSTERLTAFYDAIAASSLPALPSVNEDDTGAALDRLAGAYKPADIYRFIRFIRANRNGNTITDWVGREMAKDIAEFMRDNNTDYGRARRAVGHVWGFTGDGLINFNTIADQGWRDEFGTEPDRPRGRRTTT